MSIITKDLKRFKEDKDIGETYFDPTTLLAPLPVVMATVGNAKTNNIITIAWTGIINSRPPITYISVQPIRASYKLLKEYKTFTINLVDENLAKACDWCGIKSAKNIDKWENLGLERKAGIEIDTPSIKGAPVSLECRVINEIELGSHTMFMAEIVKTRVRTDLVDEKGRIALEKANLVTYYHGHYYAINRKPIGRFGYSVMKPKTKRKLKNSNKNK